MGRRILLCCPVPLDRRLGTGKHWLELADGLARLGWDVRAVGPGEVIGADYFARPGDYATGLRDYLRAHAGSYDVAEFDHTYLPFPRADFPPAVLLVARVMLLQRHFLTTRLPAAGLRTRVGRLLGRGRRGLREMVRLADETCRNADAVAVNNDRDAAAVTAGGVDPAQVGVFPPGLTAARRSAFAAAPADPPPGPPTVAFVGTFDPRKGMVEFPRLAARLAARVPGVRFRLLGTAGLVPDAAGVLARFPAGLRPRLEVHPWYDPDDMPRLLSGGHVGVFPSWVESFGYGVLEMLAAAVPVVGYDAPGPHLMIPPADRAAVGDWRRVADRAAELLLVPRAELAAARRAARERAADFDWDDVCRRTADWYAAQIAARGRRP